VSYDLSTSLISTLFGGSSSTGIGTDLLSNYFAAQAGSSAAAANAGSSPATLGPNKTTSPTGQAQAPDAPWFGTTAMPNESALVQKVMQGQRFIDPNGVTSNVIGSSPDYTKLFTLYQGLNALEGIASAAQAKNVSPNQLAQYQQRFNEGMTEVDQYVNSTKFDHVSLTEGALTSDLKNTVGTAENTTTYTGQNIATGSATAAVPAFSGAVQFSMSIKRIGTATPIVVNFDLSQMGSTTRSMSNVVSYMNAQLKAAGVSTRMAVNRTPGTPLTTTINGQTITLSQGTDTFGLQIHGSSAETVTLSAANTAQSVYVVQTTGDPTKKPITPTGSSTSGSSSTSAATTGNGTDVTSQVMKFQTGVVTSGTAPAAPIGKPGDTYWTAGESEQINLPGSLANVTTTTSGTTTTHALTGVRASAAGADGSLYVLADVNGTTDGQAIKGPQDVALMKYDSAGNLVYTRTLGAAGTATAASIAVSADGKVAIAGSITGALDVATTTTAKDGTITTTNSGNLNGSSATNTDSFVQVFDAGGVPQWTQRFGSSNLSQATTVTFGANDSVIVGGKTMATMTGATANGGKGEQGGWDSYVAGFSATGQSTFMQQTGTPQSDSTSQVAVSGNTMYVASIQNNVSVLSSYDLTSGKPVLIASRNIGGLGGGSITGISVYNGQVYLGGSTSSNQLLAGTGTVTAAYGSGYNAFALSVNADLTNTTGDTVAYYGGSGAANGAKVQFANGVAYMSGQATGAISGTTQVGKGDAYLASLNVATGQVLSQTRYSGNDGLVSPDSIAVSSGSSSVLDQLGLPTGTVLQTDSPDIIANSSVRTGDQFYMLNPLTGVKQTITIDAGETMQTLAAKIQKASGFQLTVTETVVPGTNGQPMRQGLDIKPAYGSSSMQFLAGPAGQDALAGLGLSPGLVTSQAGQIMDPKASNYTRSQKPMGLNFNTSLNLNTPQNIAAAISSLQATLQKVQSVYTYLSNGDPQPTKPGAKSQSSAPPQYLSDQIANYQAALQRLTGGS
jgi:hypothetical protein